MLLQMVHFTSIDDNLCLIYTIFYKMSICVMVSLHAVAPSVISIQASHRRFELPQFTCIERPAQLPALHIDQDFSLARSKLAKLTNMSRRRNSKSDTRSGNSQIWISLLIHEKRSYLPKLSFHCVRFEFRFFSVFAHWHYQKKWPNELIFQGKN